MNTSQLRNIIRRTSYWLPSYFLPTRRPYLSKSVICRSFWKMANPPPATRYEINLADKQSDDAGDTSYSRATSVSAQLEKIPRDARSLFISDDVPADAEWEVIGAHLTSVEDLEVDAGWKEELNDRSIPLHWPLKRLIVTSSCGDVTQTPYILLGKVHHLVFFLASGIRFEGPTSDALNRAHREAVDHGDKEEHSVTDGGIKITYTPSLVDEWMQAKYVGKDIEVPSAEPYSNPDLNLEQTAIARVDKSSSEAINLVHLELLENDAIDMFLRFTLALPNIAYNLRTLNIRSTIGCDLNSTDGRMFPPMLQTLTQLETLVLTLGESFIHGVTPYDDDDDDDDDDVDGGDEETKDDSTTADTTEVTDTNKVPGLLHSLHESFPPNLQTLRLRLPITLTQKSEWENWIKAFSSPEYLPHLSTLSVACDLSYSPEWKMGSNRGGKADEATMTAAKKQVGRLVDAVRARGGAVEVKMEPFVEKWAGKSTVFDDVDERFYQE